MKAVSGATLLLCAPLALAQGGGADIVFVYDNSGSMWSQYAKRDTGTGDTAFFHAASCHLPGAGAGGVIGTPFTYETWIGPRTVQWVDSTVVCVGHAGDPYVARTAILAQAVDFLADRFPASTVGAVAFAHDTAHARAPLPLSVPGNAATIKASLALDSLTATQYVPPLALATSWLRDTALARNPRQAIVFLSDGEPNDASRFTAWIGVNTGIPIYAVALGDTSVAPFARMQQMSLMTGGRFYSVPPRDVPGMNRVMEDILARLTAGNVSTRPAPGARVREGAFRPEPGSVDAAGRRHPDRQAPGIRFPSPR